jgi:hypothetical protein
VLTDAFSGARRQIDDESVNTITGRNRLQVFADGTQMPIPLDGCRRFDDVPGLLDEFRQRILSQGPIEQPEFQFEILIRHLDLCFHL